MMTSIRHILSSSIFGLTVICCSVSKSEEVKSKDIVNIKLEEISIESLVYRINLLVCDLLVGDLSKKEEITLLLKNAEDRIMSFPDSNKKISKEVMFEGTKLASVYVDRATVKKLIDFAKWHLQ